MNVACEKKAAITMIDHMIRWGVDRLEETRYTGWCLFFIQDAPENPWIQNTDP